MKFGLAIPCYKYHIPVLKRCLDSIEQQTKKPDIVVVSCSSCVREDIPIYSYSFPLEILVCSEKKNAAENRNIAGNRLLDLDCSHIGFFDCDDEMHPQRIEYIIQSFTYIKDCSIVLHSYWGNNETEQPFIQYKFFNIERNELVKSPTGCAYLPKFPSKRIHHSQVSIKASYFKEIKFRESSYYERIGSKGGNEDALFCGDILSLKQPNAYISDVLSKYYQEGETH
jgi:hypothetical protein